MANVLSTLAGMGIDKICNGIGGLAKDLKEVFTGKASPETIAKARLQLNELEIQAAETQLKQKQMQTDIIVAEAKSDSWLAKSWRPLTMLLFAVIIFNDAIIVPYLDMFMKESIKELFIVNDKVWIAINVGLGGYVVGRTTEKIIDKVKNGKKGPGGFLNDG